MARKRNQPHAVILAGPNGAGKSTTAPALLADTLEITEFVNADVIARGLSGFDPDNAAMEAGAVMHRRLRE
jgi:predicted ABC-type ATPase